MQEVVNVAVDDNLDWAENQSLSHSPSPPQEVHPTDSLVTEHVPFHPMFKEVRGRISEEGEEDESESDFEYFSWGPIDGEMEQENDKLERELEEEEEEEEQEEQKQQGKGEDEDEDKDEDGENESQGRKQYPPGSEQQPLFETSKVNVLGTVLLLMDWKQEHLISDAAFSALLPLLHCVLLPEGNLLPSSLYLCEGILESQAPKVLRDVCVNECHLFSEGEEACPVCKEQRFGLLFFFLLLFLFFLPSSLFFTPFHSSCYRYEQQGQETHANVKKKARRSFTSFSVVEQLRCNFRDQEFLDALHATAEFLQRNPTSEETIWEGDLFRPFRQPGAILSEVEEGMALSVGLDGAPPFVTATGSFWVIILKIWNLPAHLRTKKKFRLFFAIVKGEEKKVTKNEKKKKTQNANQLNFQMFSCDRSRKLKSLFQGAVQRHR